MIPILLLMKWIYTTTMESPLHPSEIQQVPTQLILRQCEGLAGIIGTDCPPKATPYNYQNQTPGSQNNIPQTKITPLPDQHSLTQTPILNIPQQQMIQQQIGLPSMHPQAPMHPQQMARPPMQPQAPIHPQQMPVGFMPHHDHMMVPTNPQDTPSLSTAKLSTILKENPMARCQIVNFLEYSGVPPPWDQLLDFETTQHHQLPDPDNLFRKIRNLLLKFDRVKNCIVEALLIIEKYIGRGKAYITEDLKDLKRYRLILKAILKKLCTSPSGEVRNELYKRFYEIKCKAKNVENSFYKLRDWIIKITKLFKTL